MQLRRLSGIVICITFLILLPNAGSQSASAPAKISSLDLDRAHLMLRQAYQDIHKNYYDTTFHGVDIDTTFQQYNARLDAAQSINESFRVVAAFMFTLRDSHTFFLPPSRTNKSTPGFFMQLIGDKCYITRIRPGTDAARKLHVGDQVLALNHFKITPGDFEDIQYFVQVLSPAPTEILDIQDSNGQHRQETILATVRTGKAILDLTEGGGSADYWQLVRSGEEDEHLSRARFFEVGNTFIWKMPTFEVSSSDVDRAIGKALKQKNMIIDLRDNSGGYIDTLKEMLGHFVDHETKLADRVTRKEKKPEMIKPRSPYYSGNVTVLVNHNSASASELFARVIQLEHRGKVIGDRSAGAVMEARYYDESAGMDLKIFYGFSITSANLIMADGKSLENTGVIPDELMLPTSADLAAGKDPVLAHAVQLTGADLDPLAAGKLFPYEWPSL
jgi:carboxyl-terminal processing protease